MTCDCVNNQCKKEHEWSMTEIMQGYRGEQNTRDDIHYYLIKKGVLEYDITTDNFTMSYKAPFRKDSK